MVLAELELRIGIVCGELREIRATSMGDIWKLVPAFVYVAIQSHINRMTFCMEIPAGRAVSIVVGCLRAGKYLLVFGDNLVT